IALAPSSCSIAFDESIQVEHSQDAKRALHGSIEIRSWLCLAGLRSILDDTILIGGRDAFSAPIGILHAVSVPEEKIEFRANLVPRIRDVICRHERIEERLIADGGLSPSVGLDATGQIVDDLDLLGVGTGPAGLGPGLDA